ncbi:MAG: hypothetical protein WBF58_01485 [Xanthobacteraceae bacterium]
MEELVESKQQKRSAERRDRPSALLRQKRQKNSAAMKKPIVFMP